MVRCLLPLSRPGESQDKIDMMAVHKFSLVFENSLTDDGVTEKWFGALVAGSVPIYMGARNIMVRPGVSPACRSSC